MVGAIRSEEGQDGTLEAYGPIHARMDKITAPITADVKYWFSLPSHFSLPRFVLKITLPPMPIKRPRL